MIEDSNDAAPPPALQADGTIGLTVVDRPNGRAGRSSTPLVPDQADDATELDAGARPISVAARSSLGGSENATRISPLDALKRDELIRTQSFCYMGMVVAAGGAVALPFLPGNYVPTRIFLFSLVIAVIGLCYLLHRTRTPATFHNSFGAAIGWFIPAVAVNSAVPFFGPFSPVAILLVLGIYFIGLGSNRALATAVYLACAATQAITGGLVIAGMEDPGFVHADNLTTHVQILCQGLVQMILAATFFVARASRKSQLVAIGELERAVRAVAQREALLQEAREELQRARGSGRGRFTEHTIGHYRLGDLIGRGAMGEVYEAVDTRSTETVAIKMLASASLGNAHHVQRFLRELRTASMLDSPNVVRVVDVGEEPLPHLVMERLHGRDLAAILRERAMSHAKIVDVIRQVGAGITVAGAAGIIHRDLKPQNVFLAGTTWKVLDFGVSRIADTGDTLTAGHVVGTPSYMAPEQARGRDVDHRSDLYSLAAIAYRALTGHAPFSGGELADLLYRVVYTAPRRPSSLAALHDDVDLVLAIGLAKQPDDRFANAVELADALELALAGQLGDSLRARARTLIAAAAT
jgi:eukaryotic-like serine/threonine-protein kinase